MNGLRHAQLARPALAGAPRRTALAVTVLVIATVVLSAVVGLALYPFLPGLDTGRALRPVEAAAMLLVVPLAWLPAALGTAWWVLGMSPGQVCSVTGRFRWRWFGLCLLPAAAVVAVTSTATGPLPGPLPPDLPALLAVVLCLAPVAAFTEEVLFRGVLVQLVGAHWRIAAAAVPSALVFALTHGRSAPAALAVTFVGGLVWTYLCDRTGGIEASTAAHTLWNVPLLLVVVLGVPAGDPDGALPFVLLTDLVLVAVLTLLARWRGVQRESARPPVAAQRRAGGTS